MSEYSSPPDSGQVSSAEKNRGELIARDLDEVYLLLDHLSGRSDRGVADLFLDGTQKESLVAAVSKIRYPPAGGEAASKSEDAVNAEKLLRARDILNQAAQPATGASIAFTILVANARKPLNYGSQGKKMKLARCHAVI